MMSIYIKDESHPIPDVDVCDVEIELLNGSADLVVVIASPLQNDRRSCLRLMRKMDNYLGYVTSETFAQHHGKPTPEKTRVTVRYHPDTSQDMIRLLNDCHGWIEDSGATLILKSLGEPHFPRASQRGHF
jgi:hypothetical protein